MSSSSAADMVVPATSILVVNAHMQWIISGLPKVSLFAIHLHNVPVTMACWGSSKQISKLTGLVGASKAYRFCIRNFLNLLLLKMLDAARLYNHTVMNYSPCFKERVNFAEVDLGLLLRHVIKGIPQIIVVRSGYPSTRNEHWGEPLL